MEVITGAEAPEYLREPYAKKVGTAVTTTKNITTPVKGDTGHKVQDSRVESYPNKDSTKTQDNCRHRRKNLLLNSFYLFSFFLDPNPHLASVVCVLYLFSVSRYELCACVGTCVRV